jgi:hypothetical protein
MWGFTTVVAAAMATLALATLMWGGAALPLVLPVALVALGIAAVMDYRRRRPGMSRRDFTRERQRAEANDPESTEDAAQPL